MTDRPIRAVPARRALALVASVVGAIWAAAMFVHGGAPATSLFRALPLEPGTAFAILVGPTGLTFPCWVAARSR